MTVISCKACGQSFKPYNPMHVCSYVGAVHCIRGRAKLGIYRSNARLIAAFEQYPPESFTFGLEVKR